VRRTFQQAELATVESRAWRSHEQRVTPDRTKFSCTQSLADHIERFDTALTARELAQILSVATVTIFKMAKRGTIPSFRVGSCVRFCPRTVAHWLRQRGG